MIPKEQKRLMALAIFPKPISLPLHPRAQGFEDKKGSFFLFGISERREDDPETTLRFALSQTHPNVKMVVKEVWVPFLQGVPRITFQETFEKDLALIENGDVLVSPEIAKIFDRLFLFEKVEKNGGELFFLQAIRKRPDRLRGLTPSLTHLVGRKKEASIFEEVLLQIQEDQGQILTLTGEPGVGKTRLVTEFKNILAQKNIPFFEAACPLQREVSRPFQPFLTLLPQLLDQAKKCSSQKDFLPQDEFFIHMLVGSLPSLTQVQNFSEEELRMGFFLAVKKLIHHLSKNSSLALIIEDIHWADEHTLSLLEFLIQDIEKNHFLFLFSQRPEKSFSWDTHLNHRPISLYPLTQLEADELIQKITKVDRVVPSVQRKLWKMTKGNPLFIEECLRQWLEGNALEVTQTDEGKKTLRVSQLDQKAISPTLHSLITSRLDTLLPEHKEILQWGSLLGFSFPFHEVEPLLEEEIVKNLSSSLQNLCQKGYLVEKSFFPKRIFEFQHGLIFDVVRETLPLSEKQNRHQKIAQQFSSALSNDQDPEVDRVAFHFLQSKDSKAKIIWAFKAGKRNFSLLHYPVAQEFFKAAVEEWKNSSFPSIDGNELYEFWIRALLKSNEHDSTLPAFREWSNLAASSENPKTRGSYQMLAAEFYQSRDEPQKWLDAAHRAIEAFSEFPSLENEKWLAQEQRIGALCAQENYAQALHEGLGFLKELHHPFSDLETRMWIQLANVLTQTGNISQALEYLRKAQNSAPDHFSLEGRISFHKQYSQTQTLNLENEEALFHANEALRLAQEIGRLEEIIKCQLLRASQLRELGQYAKALQEVLTLSNFQPPLSPSLQIQVLLSLTQIYVDLKDFSQAQNLLEQIEKKFPGRLLVRSKDQRSQLKTVLDLAQGKKSPKAPLTKNQSWSIEKNCETIIWEASQKNKSKAKLEEEFQQLSQKKPCQNSPKFQILCWITSLELSHLGLTLEGVNPNQFKPMKIQPLPLRHKACSALSRFFSFQKNIREASHWKTQTQKTEQEILDFLPHPYRNSFFENSFS